MIRWSERGILLLLITIFAAAMLVNAEGLRRDVYLVPRVIAIPLLALAAVATIAEMLPAIGARLHRMAPLFLQKMLRSTVTADTVAESSAEQRGRYRFITWAAAYIGLTYFIGIFWATGIAVFAWLKLGAGEKWWGSLLYALGAMAFIYGVFVQGFSYEYFMRPEFEWWRL